MTEDDPIYTCGICGESYPRSKESEHPAHNLTVQPVEEVLTQSYGIFAVPDPEETVVSAADLGLSTEQLIAALRRSAKGMYPSEAAVELLVAHGHWLRDEDFRRSVDVGGDADDDLYGEIMWERIIDRQGYPVPAGSASERRILMIAASLDRGVAVDLREAMSGLDDRNLRLVLAAAVHANGASSRITIPLAPIGAMLEDPTGKMDGRFLPSDRYPWLVESHFPMSVNGMMLTPTDRVEQYKGMPARIWKVDH